MLSFSKVLTFAAVAFGTLSQAAPFDPRDVSIEARASDPVQLQIILTDVKTQLASKLEPICTGVQFTPTLMLLTPRQIYSPLAMLRCLLSTQFWRM